MSETKTKHTPGPWTMRQIEKWPFKLVTTGPNGELIAETTLASWGSADKTAAQANAREGNAEFIANERLRTAAPDLADALDWMLDEPDNCARCRRVGHDCVGHAALRKAGVL